MSYYRFLENTQITTESCVQSVQVHANQNIKHQHITHVLAIHDQSQIGLGAHRNRIRTAEFGVVGTKKDPGLYVHPTLLVDAVSGLPVGWGDIQIFKRKAETKTKLERKYQTLPFEDKESRFWRHAIQNTSSAIPNVLLTYVADRESDIFEVWEAFDAQRTHGIIRASRDRKTPDGNRLYEQLSQGQLLGCAMLEVKADPRKKRVARTANLEIRVEPLKIQRPKNHAKTLTAKEVVLYGVEVREVNCPVGQDPILWRLLTTHTVESLEDAQGIVFFYSQRWLIERVFHVLKAGVLDVEAVQLEQGLSFEKLLVFGLAASIPILLLIEARDGLVQVAGDVVLNAVELDCLSVVGVGLEGRTKAQKNPHVNRSLAWVAWVIARLGGWKGYVSERPPGTKTMSLGLRRFFDLYQGWSLLRNRDVCKP
jgi:Transposase DDE domain